MIRRLKFIREEFIQVSKNEVAKMDINEMRKLRF